MVLSLVLAAVTTDREEASEGVGDDPTSVTDDLLAGVGALHGGEGVGGGRHTLGVRDEGCRVVVATEFVRGQAVKLVLVQLSEDPISGPGVEVPVDAR